MYLMSEKTKYKSMNYDKRKVKKGNLKIMLGVNIQRNVFPIETWKDKDWESISDELRKN